MYEGWSREDLIWKIRELNRKIEELEDKNRRLNEDNYSLRFKIDTELEPRLRAERRAYDAYVTNAERGSNV